MLHIREEQCGLCAQFGEEHPQDQRLTQIRSSLEASEEVVYICGHPTHERLHGMSGPPQIASRVALPPQLFASGEAVL